MIDDVGDHAVLRVVEETALQGGEEKGGILDVDSV